MPEFDRIDAACFLISASLPFLAWKLITSAKCG